MQMDANKSSIALSMDLFWSRLFHFIFVTSYIRTNPIDDSMKWKIEEEPFNFKFSNLLFFGEIESLEEKTDEKTDWTNESTDFSFFIHHEFSKMDPTLSLSSV